MKNQFYIPLVLLLALLVGACGKKQDPVVNTAAVGVPGVQPIPGNPYPWPTPTPGTPNDLASFCQSYGGQLSGSVCIFEKNYQNNSWFSMQWGDLNTGVAVYSGERVIVNVSGSPRIYVGSTNYATGSASFVSNTSGYLSFQRFSQTYSVQQIRIQSCLSSPYQRVACP